MKLAKQVIVAQTLLARLALATTYNLCQDDSYQVTAVASMSNLESPSLASRGIDGNNVYCQSETDDGCGVDCNCYNNWEDYGVYNGPSDPNVVPYYMIDLKGDKQIMSVLLILPQYEGIIRTQIQLKVGTSSDRSRSQDQGCSTTYDGGSWQSCEHTGRYLYIDGATEMMIAEVAVYSTTFITDQYSVVTSSDGTDFAPALGTSFEFSSVSSQDVVVTSPDDNPYFIIEFLTQISVNAVVITPYVSHTIISNEDNQAEYSADLKISLLDSDGLFLQWCEDLPTPMTQPESDCGGNLARQIKIERDCLECKLGVANVGVLMDCLDSTANCDNTSFLEEDINPDDYIADFLPGFADGEVIEITFGQSRSSKLFHTKNTVELICMNDACGSNKIIVYNENTGLNTTFYEETVFNHDPQ